MVVVTVPFAKPPNGELGAVEFSKILENLLMNDEPMTEIIYGDHHKEILNIETAQGRNDPQVRSFYTKLKKHSLHLDIRSFEADDESLKDSDLVIGHLLYSSDTDMLQALQNLLDDYGVVSIVEVDYSTHRLSLVSLELFDTPSLIVYVNEGSLGLFERFAEDLAEFCLLYEDRSIPSV